ncbi:autotransporter outer membrane beta-barrel domain-containing protein [Citrobacter sp. ANG330]|uniref:autotransporter outer membrane beta-barrel domain-containing protein n=1 Tax=Citrobacter sp. ANG330 TaxID=3048142 RepID=UPI0039C23E12
MNKIYRVIWNHTLRVFQVCSELVNGKHQVSSVSQTVSPLPCLKNTLFADPLPSRLRVLSLLVLMALPGTSFAELVVDSSLGTPNLTITQDNPYADGGNIIVGGISGGTGELTISNGGTVTGGASTAGLSAGSSGTITVDGIGSVLNTVSMTVGHAGEGMLTITNGGVVNSTAGSTIGLLAGSKGVVDVSGGSQWNLSGQKLIVGSAGTGTLNISGGSSVITGNSGTSVGAGSKATIEGTGSSLSYGNGGLLIDGDLAITDGGQVIGLNNLSPTNVSSGGTLMVDGIDSKLTSGNFNVAAGGLMAVTNGGNVASHGNSGDTINGTVTVDGAGSVWTDSGNFFMGNVTGTTSTIAITNGGVVNLTAGGQMRANDATSRTLITIDGTGSRLITGGTFYMEGKNPADPTAIQVTNGGALSTYTINIGRLATDIASVTVEGNGSTWTTTSTTNIGLQGSGTVTLTDGALMTAGGGITIGAQKGSTGILDVSGETTVNAVNASGALQGLRVGGGGTGTLNIHADSSVTAGATHIGSGYYGDAGTGIVNVDGANAVLNTVALNVGSNGYVGVGTLNITNSGLVQSAGASYIGNALNASYSANSAGTVNVSSHSQWDLINASGAKQSLNVGQNGTGTLNVNSTGSVTAGTVALGATVTGTGVVKVAGTDAVLNTAALTVGRAGTGTLTITDSGMVDSIGAGVVSQDTGSQGDVDVSSDGQWNLVNAAGAGQTLTVGSGGTGTLNINTTATVTAGNANIGYAATGVGTVNVEGEDAVLNTAALIMGVNGEGELTITDSGVVNSTGTGTIGNAADGSGAVTVDGANSQWNLTGVLTSGAAGTGTMALTNSASVTSNGGIVGSTETGTGTVNISSGSLWNNGIGALKVGDAGTGILNVNTTGTVTAGNTTIGNAAAGTGTVNVSGVNAVMNMTSLTTGASGQGTLAINDGGVVNTTGTGITGSGAGSTGTVTVDGAGSQWNLTGSLTTGAAGNGTMTLTNEAVVTSVGGFVGNTGAGNGSVDVSNGAVWDSTALAAGQSASLMVGNAATGAINIHDGGVVESSSAILGNAATSDGSVTVDGQDSVLNTADLTVGQSGTGSLDITNGGKVSVTNISTIGAGAGGNGTATVEGANSQWISNSLIVGGSGSGTVTLTDGALLQSGYASLGKSAGGNGTVNVSSGAVWNDSTNLIEVGDAGTGSLNINAGGTVNTDSFAVGVSAGGEGTVLVDGADAVLNTGVASGPIWAVGYRGTGDVQVSNGGLMTSKGGSLGQFAGSHGSVIVSSDGQWTIDGSTLSPLIVGDAGTGTLTITAGGSVTADDITAGAQAGGTGVINVSQTGHLDMDGLAVIGQYGNGTLNITEGGTVNSNNGLILGGLNGPAQPGAGTGVLNVEGPGSTLIQNGVVGLAVGQAGTGFVNIRNGGVVSEQTVVGVGALATTNGTITVDGAGSLLRSPLVYLGMAGTGTLTLSNSGTLDTNNPIALAMQAGSSGTLNIGAAHGESAAGAGFITGADSVNMGAGSATLVFNHTETDPTTAGAYQFTPLITGNGTVIQDAGHTVLSKENTFNGATQINGGTLTTTSQSTTGNTGLGTSTVNIAAPGTLDVAGATTDGTGNFTFSNVLTGSGLLSVDLASADDIFSFASSAGTAFTGTADLQNSTFALSGDNAAALTQAMLMTSTGNTTMVSGGVQHTDGLAFNGGTLALDISLPGAALSDGVLQTGTLVAGAGTFSRNGRDLQASGTGNVQVTLTDPWNDPGLTADPDTRLNLLQQDDTRPAIQLVQADTVIGSGGALTLTDQNGNAIGTDESIAIAQNGTVVADGQYGIRLTTAPGDGLYVNYGLKEVDIRAGKTLTLAEFAGASGADADMSAKISGTGNLAISTDGRVSLSNGLNDYSGTTLVQAGTLRTDADGALGDTGELHIYSTAKADLNGTEQTAGQLAGDVDSVLNINGGMLNLTSGGYSNGSLTGAGSLNVTGGTLTIDGANSGLSATTTISNGAQVVMNDAQGAGTGDIKDNGTLMLDGVTGSLANRLSGQGIVSLNNATDVMATADNRLFTGTWDVTDGTRLHASGTENTGTATVSTHNTGILSLDAFNGDLDSRITGAGTVALTSNADVTVTDTGSSFTGTYDVQTGSTLHVTDATLPAAATLKDNGLIDLASAGAFTLQNVLTGAGVLKVDTADGAFNFSSTAGNAFTGTVDLNNATLELSGVNTSALTSAILKANVGSITTVADGEQTIGGLAFAGGEMVFNATAPDGKMADSHITAGTLDATGNGTVQILLPETYVPDHETDTRASLMTQDEANVKLELASAAQVTGSGGNLMLHDQNGNTISDATEVDIAQGGNTVAKGTWDFRVTTTGTTGSQDGLYVNYGLKELEILQNQTLTLDGTPGATAAAADQSARITGSGNLAISTTGDDVLSLSNSSNDYTGDTTVVSGTLRTDVDGALGATAKLTINSGAKTDLNGTTQSAGRLNTLQDGTLALNNGTLNLSQGGRVQGEITGGGQLNVSGGILTMESTNSDMTAGVAVADSATIVLASPDTVLGGAGAGEVTVASGGMLGGQGLVGGSVMNSGTLIAMNALPGHESAAAALLTLGGNLSNSGTVNLAGSKTGNQLVVNGNYTGNDGQLSLNTTLNGDNSPTDKLTVHGDTSGNTRVDVNNVGGTGAQTINGIELVQVDGRSAGNFALTNGSVEAGAYVYTLAKGTGEAAKNWYLTSKWNGAVPAQDPPVVDPTAPDALRPEAGSYISNIAAANTLFNHRLHDRLGEPQYTDALRNGDGNVSSLWMRHVGGHERSSAGSGQLKTQSNRYVLQLGGDIAQWSADGLDRWHLGVMGGYANERSHTRSDRAGYGSDGRVSGYSAGLYGTWYQNDADKTGMYVDSWMLYNWFDNTVEADNRESDSYKSKGLTASLEAGYTLKAGEFWGSEGTLNTWYVQPQAQITWMGVKDNAHTRHDGTRIETQGDGNIHTRLGVRTYLNSHHKMDDGKQRTFQPFVEVNWIHNTESFGVKMDGTTVSRDGARNLGEVRTGVEGKLNDRLSVWGSVGVQMGDKGYSDTQGMLGVKYNW